MLQALVLVRLLPWIARQPFAASYWAFSFGATALSTAALQMVERGDTGAVALLAVPLFVGANLVIAVLSAGTVFLAAQRRLLPHPAKGADSANRSLDLDAENPVPVSHRESRRQGEMK